MAKRKKTTKTVQPPHFNPKDFDMPDYDCVFIQQQDDGTLVGAYRYQGIENRHWLVVKGQRYVRCETLADVKAYCEKKHYYIGVGV